MPSIGKMLRSLMAVDRSLADLLQEHNSTTKKYELGSVRYTLDGMVFQYVKASEALTRGQSVMAAVAAAWDSTVVIDGAVISADTDIHVDTNTSAFTLDQYKGYWIRQAGASGKGQAVQIKNHAAIDASSEVDIYLERAAGEAIADGAVLLIFHPYIVEAVGADIDPIKGVMPSALDSGSYGWMQIGGYVPAILVGHSTSKATVIGEPLQPIAALDGSVQGIESNAEAQLMAATLSPLRALDVVAANTVGFIQGYMRCDM